MGRKVGPGKPKFSRQKAMAVERLGETGYRALLGNVRAYGAGAQDMVVKTW